MEVLKKGTIESLLVHLRDRMRNIDSLGDVTNLRFDTKKKDDSSACETNKTATFDIDDPMVAICEIDTSLAAYVIESDDDHEEFKLYLKYTAGTENPILGPVFFRVEDD